jgi:hypothetical protein
MTKTKVRRMEKVSGRRNGVIIVNGINIKTLLKMGRGCQMMVIFRREYENFRDMTSVNQECILT